MNIFNAIEDFPETYIYNNYNYDVEDPDEKRALEVDIDQVVFQLLKCEKDKEKFDQVIENLEKHFMGEDFNSGEEEKKANSKKNLYSERNNNNIGNNNNGNSNYVYNNYGGKSNSQRKLVDQNNNNVNSMRYKASSYNNDRDGGSNIYSNRMYSNINSDNKRNIPNANANLYPSSKLNIPLKSNNELSQPIPLHKKYTDVHANTKYYYPSEYNTNFEDNDLYFEPSQWTDRANRSFLYNTGSTSYLKSNSLNNTFNDSLYINTHNTIPKDNTNAVGLNRQMQYMGSLRNKQIPK